MHVARKKDLSHAGENSGNHPNLHKDTAILLEPVLKQIQGTSCRYDKCSRNDRA
jgi:hypothetical protein